MALKHICYAGNIPRRPDLPLPATGEIYGVTQSGNLLYYRFNGTADFVNWVSLTGKQIGDGWQNFRQILGCGNNTILAIKPNGDLLWYRVYLAPDAEAVPEWHANSGHQIGNGWQNFRHVFAGSATAGSIVIYAVQQNGDLLWYSYTGSGETDPSGTRNWSANSGHQIGNGWQNFRTIFGGRDWNHEGVGEAIYGVEANGIIRWYGYNGNGETDPSGTRDWYPNSGKAIGSGW